jgi:hypothetical protein
MQHTLPHLVEAVLAETTTTFEQRLELGRLGVADKRWHLLNGTGRQIVCSGRFLTAAQTVSSTTGQRERHLHPCFQRPARTPPARTTRASTAGFSSGFNVGFDSGFNVGFDSGFNPGFAAGFNPGFNAGYKARHHERHHH